MTPTYQYCYCRRYVKSGPEPWACDEPDCLPPCESCGAPADVVLCDGSTWCLNCDFAARDAGYDNKPGVLIEGADK